MALEFGCKRICSSMYLNLSLHVIYLFITVSLPLFLHHVSLQKSLCGLCNLKIVSYIVKPMVNDGIVSKKPDGGVLCIW